MRTFEADAAIAQAKGEAGAKTANATADAMVLTTVGNAEAGKIQAIGTAQAKVQTLLVESIGAEAFMAIQVAGKLAENNIKLVPDIMVNGGGEGQGGGIVDALIGNLLKDQLKTGGALALAPASTPEVSAATDAESTPSAPRSALEAD